MRVAEAHLQAHSHNSMSWAPEDRAQIDCRPHRPAMKPRRFDEHAHPWVRNRTHGQHGQAEPGALFEMLETFLGLGLASKRDVATPVAELVRVTWLYH